MSRRVRWHARFEFPCIFITIREKYRSSTADAIRWRRPTKDREEIPRNPFVKPTGQSVATTMSLFSLPRLFPSVSVPFDRIPSHKNASPFLSFFFLSDRFLRSLERIQVCVCYLLTVSNRGHDLASTVPRRFIRRRFSRRILERHSTGERATMTLIVRPRTMVSAGVTKIDTSWPANFRPRGAIVGKRARVNYPGGLHNRFFDFAPAPSLAKLVTS